MWFWSTLQGVGKGCDSPRGHALQYGVVCFRVTTIGDGKFFTSVGRSFVFQVFRRKFWTIRRATGVATGLRVELTNRVFNKGVTMFFVYFFLRGGRLLVVYVMSIVL